MKNQIRTTAVALLFSIMVSAQTQVTFYTNYGNFQVEIYDSIMPITGGNFLSLVNSEFYDGIIFHRIISNFVIQGGDPLGNGTGGPGYSIPDEFDTSGTLSNLERTLSMANAGPNTGGSQFFINLKDNTFLDFDKAPLTSAHPVFGFVNGSWNIVDSIGKVPTGANDRPIIPVVMDSIRVTGSALSVEEIERAKFTTAVYPNPINSESILDIYSAQAANAEIALFDAQGRLISENTLRLPAGKSKIPLVDIEVNNLQAGVYYLSLKTRTSQKQLQIVKL